MKWLAIILVVQFAFHCEPAPVVAQENLSSKEIAKCQIRLTHHFNAFVSWVDHVCQLSEDQKNRVNLVVLDEIEKYIQFIKLYRSYVSQNDSLKDYSPIRFVSDKGASGAIFHAGLGKKILKHLDNNQQEKYRQASREREESLHQYFLTYLVNKVDEQLFLNADQRKQLGEILEEKFNRLESGAYAFAPQSYSVVEQAFPDFLASSSLALNQSQKTRLLDLLQPPPDEILLQIQEEKEVWFEKLDAAILAREDLITRALEPRIAYVSSLPDVTSAEIKYLQVAWKGASIKVNEEWKNFVNDTYFKPWGKVAIERPNLNYTFNVSVTRISEFDRSPFWQNALKKVMPEELYKQRVERHRIALAGYGTALLDQELWLTSNQQKQAYNALLNSYLCEDVTDYSAYPLCLIGMTTCGKVSSKIEVILSQSQLQAYETLKSQFQINQNYLMIGARTLHQMEE